MSFRVTTAAFANGAAIPRRFTCDGEDLSPALEWAGEPANTKSFALIVDDPDAPGGTWNHWLLWDIPASLHALEEGDSAAGATSGTNDFGNEGYGGPCPPRGRGSHRYFFRLFAVDVPSLGLPRGARRDTLERALRSHTLAKAEYLGHYGRR